MYVFSVYRRRVVSIEVFDNRDSRFPFGIFIARRERERFISRSESTPSFTRRCGGQVRKHGVLAAGMQYVSLGPVF